MSSPLSGAVGTEKLDISGFLQYMQQPEVEQRWLNMELDFKL